MKKPIKALVFAGLALSLLSCNSNKQEDPYENCGGCSTTQKDWVSVYLNSLSNVSHVSVTYMNDDVPYIELGEAFSLRKTIFDAGLTYETPRQIDL